MICAFFVDIVQCMHGKFKYVSSSSYPSSSSSSSSLILHTDTNVFIQYLFNEILSIEKCYRNDHTSSLVEMIGGATNFNQKVNKKYLLTFSSLKLIMYERSDVCFLSDVVVVLFFLFSVAGVDYFILFFLYFRTFR